MLAAALALVVVGLPLGLLAPPFGFAPVVIGIVLFIAALVGAGKRAAEPGP